MGRRREEQVEKERGKKDMKERGGGIVKGEKSFFPFFHASLSTPFSFLLMLREITFFNYPGEGKGELPASRPCVPMCVCVCTMEIKPGSSPVLALAASAAPSASASAALGGRGGRRRRSSPSQSAASGAWARSEEKDEKRCSSTKNSIKHSWTSTSISTKKKW